MRSVRSLTAAYPFLRGTDAWRASLDVVVPPFEPKLSALLEWTSRNERVAVVWVEGRRSPHDVLVTGLHDRTVTVRYLRSDRLFVIGEIAYRDITQVSVLGGYEALIEAAVALGFYRAE